MTIADLDREFGIDPAGVEKQSATVNLASSYGVNPDEHAEKLRLEKETGTPSALMTDPNVFKSARRRAYEAALNLDNAPATATFASDPNNATLINDDVHNLKWYEEQKIPSFRAMTDAQKNDTDITYAASLVKDSPLKSAYALGTMQQKLGRLGYQKLSESTDPNIDKEISFLDNDISALTSILNKQPGFQGNILNPTATIIGQMGDSAKKAIGTALMGASAGALAGAAGGPLAPVTSSAGALTGFGSGFTAGLVGDIFTTEAGNAYLEINKIHGKNNETVNPAVARAAALGVGAANAALEITGLELLTAPIRQLVKSGIRKAATEEAEKLVTKSAIGTALKAYSTGVTGEVVTEVAQEVTNILSEELTKSLSDGSFEYTNAEEVGKRLYDIASQTFRGTLLLGVPGGVSSMAHAKSAQRSAQTSQDIINGMIESADMSMLKQRMPDKYSDWLQDAATRKGLEAVYFQADRLFEAAINNGVTEDQIPSYLSRFGVSPQQVADAAQRDGLIEMKIGPYVTAFKSDPVLQSLQGETMISPDGYSVNGAKDGVALDQGHMQHMDELYQEDVAGFVQQEDVDLWKQEILTGKTNGLVTPEHLDLMVAFANNAHERAKAEGKDLKAIDVLRDMLKPQNVSALTYKEWQALSDERRKQFKSNRPRVDSRPVGPMTLRGRIKQLGGINFLNFKGELRDMPVGVKYLSSQSGTPVDLVEQTLKDEGWLDQSEDLLETFRTTPDILKRGKVISSGSESMTGFQKQQEEEFLKNSTYEAEAPEGAIEVVKANTLEIGKAIDIIDGVGLDGWNSYIVVDVSPFDVTLMAQDESIIILGPDDDVQLITNTTQTQENPDGVQYNQSAFSDRDLIITHNLTGENLLHAVRMGGIPVPSLSITKKDQALENFGDITLIGSKNMADPKGYANTKVFGADVYSPRYPDITYKLGKNTLTKLNEILKPYRKEGERGVYGGDVDNPRDLRGVEAFVRYVSEKTGEEHPDGGVMETEAQKLLLKAGAEEKIFQGYTNSGNRKYTPHTLENVVKILKKELRGGEGFNYGVGSLRAKFTPQFRSIEQIRKAKDRLITRENFDKVKAEIDKEFFVVVDALRPHSSRGGEFGFADTVIAVMEEAPKLGVTRALKEYGMEDIPQETKQQIVEFLEKLRHLPTQYFEAKILRSVNLTEFKGAVVPKGTPQDVIDELRVRGVRIAEYEKGNVEDRRAVIDRFTSELEQEGRSVIFQKQNQNPLAATFFGPIENIVGLFERADRSSFLHESGHIFLAQLKALSEQHGVMGDVWTATKDWLRIGDDGKITRAQHEKFAEHFEKYLMDGKAPSVELRSVFRSFKKWLTRIYEWAKAPRNGLMAGIKIKPEVREIFDKILATESQREEAKSLDALNPIISEKMMAGDREELAEYRRWMQAADDAAQENMDNHKLVGRDERVKQWREQAEAAAKREPVYGFSDKIRELGGVSKKSIEAVMGEAPNMPGMVTNDGFDINILIAEHGKDFGYDNASDYAEDLKAMRPREVWVDKMVASLEAMHDQTLDTHEAIRTSALRKMMEIESKWLAKKAVAKEPMTRKAMRVWADKMTAEKTIGEIRKVSKLITENKKRRQKAIVEAKSGNFEKALKLNEQARLTEELISSSYRAMKEWSTMESRWKKVAKWTNDNKSIKQTTAFREQLNRLLGEYQLSAIKAVVGGYDTKIQDVHAFIDDIQGDELDDTNVQFPDWIGREVVPVKELNFGKVSDLNDCLNYIYKTGKEVIEGKKLSDGKSVEGSATEIELAHKDLKNTPDLISDRNFFSKLFQSIQKGNRIHLARTRLLRFIAVRADGFTDVSQKNDVRGESGRLYHNIVNGITARNDALSAFHTNTNELIRELSKDNGQKFDDIFWPESMKRQGMAWNKERVVCFCLNMGNEENLMKAMNGYGLTSEDVSKIASKLTDKEWQMVARIGRELESFWPQIADTHEKMKFVRPKKIEVRPISIVAAGENQVDLPGWYYPASPDPKQWDRKAQWNEQDDIMASNENILQTPVARSGFTNQRTGAYYPINLSLSVLTQHVFDATTYIHVALPVRDFDRVFRNKDLVSSFKEKFGQDMYDMIRPALKATVRPERNDHGRFWNYSNKAASMCMMAYNVWQGVQNFSNIFPAAFSSGNFGLNFVSGIAHVIKTGPLDAYRAMLEADAYMRSRDTNFEHTIGSQVKGFSMTGVEIFGKYINTADINEINNAVGYGAMKMVDNLIVTPTWWGKYNAEMDKHGDMQKAISAAGASVAKAFGSGNAIDTTWFQRNKGFWGLISKFMTYVATQSENLSVQRGAYKAGKIHMGELMYGHFMVLLAPAIMTTFLSFAVRNGLMAAFGGDDKDDKNATWLDYVLGILTFGTSHLPLVRDVIGTGARAALGEYTSASTRVTMTMFFDTFLKGTYDAVKLGLDPSEKKAKKLLWDFADVVSFATMFPASQIARRMVKGMDDIKKHDGNWWNLTMPQDRKK